ncbi:MAG: hypothetical protein H0U63_00515 [Burkholderiales bacterium]|nr:hypothetical protein [Burkholderiales bacterium]
MASKTSDYWRSKGEQDRAANKGYHKPHGLFSGLITWTVAGMSNAYENNVAYHEGWISRRNREN